MTLNSVKEALHHFECQVELDYPAFEEMCLIEARPDGKEAKEDDASLTLYFFGNQIHDCLSLKLVNPSTNNVFEGGLPTVRPAKELFALTLAAAVAGGYLEALKKDDKDTNLQALLDRKDCKDILALGNAILAHLKTAPGDTLKEKLKALNLKEIKGTPGEVNFLKLFLPLDLKNLGVKAESGIAKSQKPLDAELAEIEKIARPPILPSLAVQRERKERALAEIRSPQYVGLGYPLERNLQNGAPSSRNERIAMRAIKDIYDPAILVQLLQEVLSIATVDKNVSGITAALSTKILGDYLDTGRNIDVLYKTIDLLLTNAQHIPGWSKKKEDSLRPYIQLLDQLIPTVMPVTGQAKICEYFVALHKLKTGMLNAHGKKISPKLQGFVDFTETMLGKIYRTYMTELPRPLLEETLRQLYNISAEDYAVLGLKETLAFHETPAHALDEVGQSRIGVLISQLDAPVVRIHMPVPPAGAAPAAVMMSQPKVGAQKINKGDLIAAIQWEFNEANRTKAGTQLGIGANMTQATQMMGWDHQDGYKIPRMDAIWTEICDTLKDMYAQLPAVIGTEDMNAFEKNVLKKMKELQDGYGGYRNGYYDCGVFGIDDYVKERLQQIWQQLAAPAQAEHKVAAEHKGSAEVRAKILGYINDMEDGMKSGNPAVFGLGRTMIASVKDVQFTQEELRSMTEALDRLHALCFDDTMKLDPQAIRDAITPCETYLQGRLRSAPRAR
jgi:hypothetical protein